MLDKLILGLLIYKDLTIYDLKKAFDEGINQFFSTSFGALHPAVKKLCDRKLITSVSKIEKGRSKKIYSLTKAGRAHFLEWLSEEISIKRIQDKGLLRVFFFKEISRRKQIALLNQYVAALEARVVKLKAVKAMHAGTKIPKKYREAFNYRVTTIDFGLGYYAFAIAWYRQLLEKIQSGEMKK
jgi:DNA-binding PadR family transcriptional regulator